VFDRVLEFQVRALMSQSIAEWRFLRPEVPPAVTAAIESEVTEADMDATLEDSFPASDPPSWTAAIARPVPGGP
jgi:hypothetical protein